MTNYDRYVEAVGKLVLNGVWFSDAFEIVHIVLGPLTAISGDAFEEDVQQYIHDTGKKVITPTYRNIF